MKVIYLCDIIIKIVLDVIAISGNSMALLAAWLSRGRKDLPSKHLIFNLNISDLLVGFSEISFVNIKYGVGWKYNEVLTTVSIFFLIFCRKGSLLNILTIAIDRYIMIVYPLWYRQYMTKNVIIAMILISWGAAFVLSIITISVLFFHSEYYAQLCANLLLTVIWITMIILYFMIWVKARAEIQRLKARTTAIGSKSDRFNNNRANKIVLSILGCCTVCWIPYLVYYYYFWLLDVQENSIVAALVTDLLISICAINPLIYAWLCPSYREGFRRIFRFKKPTKNDFRSQTQQTNMKSESKISALNDVAKNKISQLNECKVVK